MADPLTITREGDTVVIRIPIRAPTPSSSGKTLVAASTHGNQRPGTQIDGKDPLPRGGCASEEAGERHNRICPCMIAVA